jgi:hypothetical protein
VQPEETVVARQRPGKYVPAAANTHATTEEMVDAMFSVLTVSYQILNILV